MRWNGTTGTPCCVAPQSEHEQELPVHLSGKFRSTQLLCAMTDNGQTADEGAAESELHEAAWSGDLKWVKAVIEAGAAVNWRDSIGETALFGACGWGRIEVVAYLLAKGAEVNIQDKDGTTPLHWAASHGGLETMQLLIEAGARPDIPDTQGRLPVDVARRAGKGDRVALLSGIGPSTGRDGQGDT